MLTIRILSLSLGFIGAGLVFLYSPMVNSQTYTFNESEEEKMKKADKKKRQRAKFGMLLISISFLIELIDLITTNIS